MIFVCACVCVCSGENVCVSVCVCSGENVQYVCVCVPQEVGGTLIGEGRLVVMAGAEYEMVSNTSNTWFSGV